MEPTIALAGNPNAGKTTLFNILTGSHQHVGNYPGVTVEKKQGIYVRDNYRIKIIDLPGTYSLTAYSLEEVVARDFVVTNRPEVIVNIVDASNLERNLYLTLQFMELGVPVCIALNMVDVAAKRGVEINVAKLSRLLDVPVVSTIARSGRGIGQLMTTVREMIDRPKPQQALVISYGEDIDLALVEMETLIKTNQFLTDTYPARWVALKYLENDEQVRSLGQRQDTTIANQLEAIVHQVSQHIETTLDTYPEAIIADHRYGFIKSIIRQGVIKLQQNNQRLFISDKIDKVVTNRFVGPVIMVAVIMGLYHLTFTYSATPVGWVESFFGWLNAFVQNNLPDSLIKSLIVSGVIDGVGGVLGFVPLIMFMFLGISFLEDSGYLARVAYMMDRIFRIFGLHGSSVMPYILSGGIAGGCAVPGVMAARTLKSPRERIATILTAPFMNCGAKLPIFALLVAAFFSEHQARMMFIITLIAWAGALLAARLLRSTIIRGPNTPFVMELPPYRLPLFRGLAIHTLERTWQYIKKAGTIILGISILLWAMMTFPRLPQETLQDYEQQRMALASQKTSGNADNAALNKQLTAIRQNQAEASLRYSIAGRIGVLLEEISRYAGFDWRTNIALVGGFAAKEVVVSTLGTAYSLGASDSDKSAPLSTRLSRSPDWSPLKALSLIVFIIFYSPCFATVICIVREAGSWKWGVFAMAFNTAVAFLLALMVFQIGGAMGVLLNRIHARSRFFRGTVLFFQLSLKKGHLNFERKFYR